MAAEKINLPIITDPDELRQAVAELPNNPDRPIVAKLPTLEAYVDAVYGDDTASLMAQSIIRPDRGIGAHWDIHQPYVDTERPFVATYTRRGFATLRATRLDELLHEHYAQRYPEPTAEARAARRAYSKLAFKTAEVIYKADITPGTGLIVPQVPGALPLVHDIAPQMYSSWADDGGEFVKLATPSEAGDARATHQREGYRSYEEFLANEEARRQASEQRRAREDEERQRRSELADEARRQTRARRVLNLRRGSSWSGLPRLLD